MEPPAQPHVPAREGPAEAAAQPAATSAWLCPNPGSISRAHPAQPHVAGFGVGTELSTGCSGEGLSPPASPGLPLLPGAFSAAEVMKF